MPSLPHSLPLLAREDKAGGGAKALCSASAFACVKAPHRELGLARQHAEMVGLVQELLVLLRGRGPAGKRKGSTASRTMYPRAS